MKGAFALFERTESLRLSISIASVLGSWRIRWAAVSGSRLNGTVHAITTRVSGASGSPWKAS